MSAIHDTTEFDPPVTTPPDLDRMDNQSAIQSAETWHLPRSVWRKIREKVTGKNVKVAVLDTGLYRHPTLPAPFAERSFIPGQSPADGNAHGTHCSGTVCSRDEDIGVAPEAELANGKVLSNQGSGSSSGIAAGVRWATELKVDVISMSLGGGSSYQPTNEAIKDALSQGIIVCCAAGNSGFNGSSNTIGWPARSGQSVCVAALTDRGVPANFSSGGSQMTIAAPGQNILSCANSGTGFRFMSGTSMATPFNAGCWALIIEARRRKGLPSFTSIAEVNAFVRANATDMGTPGHDPATGFGQFNMMELMVKLAEDTLVYV
jgi:subtilisin family serine protease